MDMDRKSLDCNVDDVANCLLMMITLSRETTSSVHPLPPHTIPLQ